MIALVLVGYGVRGRQWARAVSDNPEARLAAVVDAAEPMRRAAGVPAHATLADAVRGHHPDAVIIATPPAAHAGLTAPLFDREIEPLQDLGFPPEQPFTADTDRLLAHFLAVVERRERAGPTAEDHLQTVDLLHACVRSAAEGRRIELRRRGEERAARP